MDRTTWLPNARRPSSPRRTPSPWGTPPTTIRRRSDDDPTTNVERRHEVAAGTVGSVIDELDRTVRGLRDRLVQEGPRLRSHINVFVDGEPGELATPVPARATVHVIPAVSGGATIS